MASSEWMIDEMKSGNEFLYTFNEMAHIFIVIGLLLRTASYRIDNIHFLRKIFAIQRMLQKNHKVQ